MSGIKADLAKLVKQAAPMTLDILKEIADMVNYENEFEFCNYAAMLTGFYLVVRSSNLVPSYTHTFNLHKQLTCWHVGLDPNLKLVMVLIEWSKNNQNYKQELWVPVKPTKEPKICLVRVLNRFFCTVWMAQHQPCFSYHNEDGEIKALTYGQLNEQIKEWVNKTGRNGHDYTTHCLR